MSCQCGGSKISNDRHTGDCLLDHYLAYNCNIIDKDNRKELLRIVKIIKEERLGNKGWRLMKKDLSNIAFLRSIERMITEAEKEVVELERAKEGRTDSIKLLKTQRILYQEEVRQEKIANKDW